MAKRLATLAALAVLAYLSVSFVQQSWLDIRTNAAHSDTARRFTASDSQHYLRIADALRGGDFRLDYVRPTGGPDLAHRQPLYPAMLATVEAFAGKDVRLLAMLNVMLIVAAALCAFVAGIDLYGSRLAALCGAWLILHVPFLEQNATQRLLTEPGFVFLGVLLVWSFLDYARQRQPAQLLICAAAGGLAYLQRPNGLFAAVSVLLACLVYDRLADWGVLESAPRIDPGLLEAPVSGARRTAVRHRRFGRYAAAAVVLAVVTVPSWLPRAIYAGNPFYHGYLPNYAWVDRYEQGHLPGPPRYTMRDYWNEHDLGDAARRVGYGLRRVFYHAPRDKYGDANCIVIAAGLALALVSRQPAVVLLLLAGVVQLLPLVWTSLSNPIQRLPATAMLPFAVMLSVAGFSYLVSSIAARVGAVRPHQA